MSKKGSKKSGGKKKECLPCKGGVPPLRGEELAELSEQLGGSWQVVDEHHLEKEYRFKDFRQALDFTNEVGEVAESQGHHPDIYLAWGKVKVDVWTHKIDGLTEADFIFAAKLEQLQDNLGCLDVELTAEHIARLDALNQPNFAYPHSLLSNEMYKGMIHGELRSQLDSKE